MLLAVKVLFWGLVSHQAIAAQPPYEEAILVVEQKHQAAIVIPLAAIKKISQIQNFLSGGRTIASLPPLVLFEVPKGSRIQYGDMTWKATTTDNAIPHLTGAMGITDGTDSDVASVPNHVSAFFDYSGGSTTALVTCPVKWKDDSAHPHCGANAIGTSGTTAPTVQFTPNPADTPKLTDPKGNVLDLEADAVVYVQNLPPPDVHQGYKEYLWLVKGNGPVGCMADLVMNGNCTPLPSSFTSVFTPLVMVNVTSPECTNSQYP
jgi:hypothetical protein